MRRFLAILLIAIPLAAQESVERLATLADVWSEVKYFHPHILMREVDWDGALVRAIPKVREAKSDADFAQAVGGLLAELGDPATRVIQEDEKPAEVSVPLHRLDGDVLVLNLGAHAMRDSRVWSLGSAISQEVAKAGKVVIDLRGAEDDAGVDYVLRNSGLTVAAVPVPPMLLVVHSGYTPQDGVTSGGYFSALQVVPSSPIPAPMRANPRAPSRIVFVTDGNELPPATAALWWSGAAAVVSEKPLPGDVLAGTRAIELADGWTAHLRVSQLAVNGLAADAIAPDPLAKALELARSSEPLPKRPPMEPASALPRNLTEERYASMTYPDLPHRLLALFRLWTIIDRFYPYRHLIGDWDAVLRTMIPRFEEAKDEKEYAAAVLETVAFVHDGHSVAYGHPAVNGILGGAFSPPRIELRLIENQYVVTKSENEALKAGDVVLAVDGEPLQVRVERLRKYITASTDVTRTNRILYAALRGAENTEAVLTLRNDDGSTREAHVERERWSPPPPDTRPLYRVLDGNIGYVDMPRLEMKDVEPMFEALKETKAIIFDMRGYPKGTAWAIAPRINVKGAKFGAQFRRAYLSAMSVEEGQGAFLFDQPLPPKIGDEPMYTRPTATLIDERAISHAEHSCLFFEAANGTTFIGTPTAGANGDVTNFPLPGGFRVMFTGHDVRHADGRQLQRIGIVPHIVAAPTVRGLREGKDEVLERAVVWANEVTRGR